MTATVESVPVAAPASTADGGITSAKKPRKPRARMRLFDDGKGDFRVFEIVPPGHQSGLPAGSLIQIPEMGGYESAVLAKRGVRSSGDLLVGKQCMILRGIEIVRVEVETQPRVRIESKPKKEVPAAPKAEKAN